MGKELKITVSFKEKEIELYTFLKTQRSPSNYIKDAVEFFRRYAKIREEKEEIKEEKTENLDLIDF